MSFSEDIRNTRRRLFLSQQQFAKEVGVSFASVNRWEAGKSLPNLITMKKIKAFCLSNNIEYENLEAEWLDNKE